MVSVASAISGGSGSDTLRGGTRTLGGTAADRGLGKVDPRLVEIIDAAAERSPYDVQIMSGYRPGDVRQHGKGNATDIVLIDPSTSERIPNYKSKTAYPIYEGFAKIAREEQMRLYPDLAGRFRWGGGFKQGVAFDLMHFDLKPGGAMVYYNWETGITEAGKEAFANLGAGKIYADGEIVDAPNGTKYANLWGRDPLIARAPIALSPVDRDVAIRTVIGESIGDGEEGMAAAAHVIANRFDQGFGPSVAAIASDPTQFDAWNRDLVTAYAPGSPEYEAAGKVVDEVFGKAKGVRPPDPTEGATFFYSGDKKPGFWSRGVDEVKRIGGHVFGVAKGAFKPEGFVLRQNKSATPDPRAAMLQQQLTRAGLYKGTVDGRYGPQTKAAVRAFQEKSGMRPTGIADGPTLQALKLPTTAARFEKALIVNPETPGNRARLFPDDALMSPGDQAVADILDFDALESLRGGKGGDLSAPSVSRDRLGTDRISGGEGQDTIGRGKVDRLKGSLDARFSAVLDKAESKLPLTDADRATIAEFQEQGGEPNEAIVQRANRVLGEHPNETAWRERQRIEAAGDRRPKPPTPSPRPARAAPPTPAGMEHKVKGGDTFGRLAKQYLGDAGRWKEIQEANPGLNPRTLKIGSTITIPGATSPPTPRERPSTAVDVLGGTDRTGRMVPAAGGTDVLSGDRTGEAIAGRYDPLASAITGEDDPFRAAGEVADSRGLARDLRFTRQQMERATTPPARTGDVPPTRRPDFEFADPLDEAAASQAVLDRADQVSKLPGNMNRTWAEVSGERYEKHPGILTDLGFYDEEPVSGRLPRELSLDAMTERYPTSRSKDDRALPFQRQDSTKRPVTPVLRQDSGLPDQPGYIEALFGPREIPDTGTVAVSQVKGDVENAPTQPTGGEFMTDTRPSASVALASDLGARRRQMEAATRPPAVITDSRPQATTRPTSLSLDAMPGADTAIQPPQDEREPVDAFDELFGIQGASALPFAEVESTSRFNAKATDGIVPTRPMEIAEADIDAPAVGEEEMLPPNAVDARLAVQNAPDVVKARRESGAYPGAITSDQAASSLPTSRAAGTTATSSTFPQSRAVNGFQPTSVGTNPAGMTYIKGTIGGAPAIQTATWTAKENPDGTFSHSYQ